MKNPIPVILILALTLISALSFAQDKKILRHVGYTEDDLPVFNALYENEGKMMADLFIYDDNMGQLTDVEKETAGFVMDFNKGTYIKSSEGMDQVLLVKDGKSSPIQFGENAEDSKNLGKALSMLGALMYPLVSLSADGQYIYMPIESNPSGQNPKLGRQNIETKAYEALNASGTFPRASGGFVHFLTAAEGEREGMQVKLLNLSSMEVEKLPIYLSGGLNIINYYPWEDGGSIFLYKDEVYAYDYYSKKFEKVSDENLADRYQFMSIYYSKKNDELMYLRPSSNDSRLLRKSVPLDYDFTLSSEEIFD